MANSIKFSVKVKGLKEIDRALRRLPAATSMNALKESLAEGAQVIADEAIRLAPYDDNPKRPPQKEHLKDGILVGNKKADRFSSTMDVGMDYTFAGAFVRWGHLVEFGTKARFRKGKGRSGAGGGYTGSARAQPFMRPAFDGKGREAINTFKKAIWKRITRAIRRRG